MNAKKLILASLAGGVVTFLLGGLWHAIILAISTRRIRLL